MSRILASATRVAINEILEKYATNSKYGCFLDDGKKDAFVNELVDFFELSRTLKARGDSKLREGFATSFEKQLE